MSVHGSAIADAIERWGGVPRVLPDAFGTADPDAVASILSEFCRRHLGAAAADYEFFAGGVGSVHGVRLTDGRRVAVKVHRADVDAEFLTAVQRIQTRIADAGMAAPRPLLAPTPIAHGVAMVEDLLDAGKPTAARDPAQRARMAADLQRFVSLATPHRAAFGNRSGFLTGTAATLYPPPHDRRFNFDVPGGEWIDKPAEWSRTALAASRGPVVVGHGDWRVENLRYDAGVLSAIYDWDSLVVRPEAALVGAVAGNFTSDWTQIERCPIPTLDEMTAFVADYETARGLPFSADERALARAALVYQTAYGARCQWSDLLTDMGRREPTAPSAPLPPDSFLTRLAELVNVEDDEPSA